MACLTKSYPVCCCTTAASGSVSRLPGTTTTCSSPPPNLHGHYRTAATRVVAAGISLRSSCSPSPLRYDPDAEAMITSASASASHSPSPSPSSSSDCIHHHVYASSQRRTSSSVIASSFRLAEADTSPLVFRRANGRRRRQGGGGGGGGGGGERRRGGVDSVIAAAAAGTGAEEGDPAPTDLQVEGEGEEVVLAENITAIAKPVLKKGNIVRVDKELYLKSVEFKAVDHPPFFSGLDYIYEDRGEVLDIREFEAGEYCLLAWAGIPTAPAWLPTYMLIKSEKLSYVRE